MRSIRAVGVRGVMMSKKVSRSLLSIRGSGGILLLLLDERPLLLLLSPGKGPAARRSPLDASVRPGSISYPLTRQHRRSEERPESSRPRPKVTCEAGAHPGRPALRRASPTNQSCPGLGAPTPLGDCRSRLPQETNKGSSFAGSKDEVCLIWACRGRKIRGFLASSAGWNASRPGARA